MFAPHAGGVGDWRALPATGLLSTRNRTGLDMGAAAHISPPANNLHRRHNALSAAAQAWSAVRAAARSLHEGLHAACWHLGLVVRPPTPLVCAVVHWCNLCCSRHSSARVLLRAR